ncbi:MAG: hypothetical protein F6K24_45410 [Okeania sp. SIO2D1]|nr:hypothetical protein [Okeania sp. SIO2D1]
MTASTIDIYIVVSITKYLLGTIEEACAKVKGEAHAFYGEAICFFD